MKVSTPKRKRPTQQARWQWLTHLWGPFEWLAVGHSQSDRDRCIIMHGKRKKFKTDDSPLANALFLFLSNAPLYVLNKRWSHWRWKRTLAAVTLGFYVSWRHWNTWSRTSTVFICVSKWHLVIEDKNEEKKWLNMPPRIYRSWSRNWIECACAIDRSGDERFLISSPLGYSHRVALHPSWFEISRVMCCYTVWNKSCANFPHYTHPQSNDKWVTGLKINVSCYW